MTMKLFGWTWWFEQGVLMGYKRGSFHQPVIRFRLGWRVLFSDLVTAIPGKVGYWWLCYLARRASAEMRRRVRSGD